MGGANLGLLTIAVAAIFPLLLIRLEPITGGTFGMFLRRPPIERCPAWTGLTTPQLGFWVCLVVLAVGARRLRNLVDGRLGRALAAVRTSSLLAAANGVDVNRTKLMAFAVSSTVAGIGGALYALVVAIAVPDSYVVTFSITFLAASVVGGSRSWAGAIIGAAIVVYLPDPRRGLRRRAGSGQLVAARLRGRPRRSCLTVAPSGLAGGVRRVARRASRTSP